MPIWPAAPISAILPMMKRRILSLNHAHNREQMVFDISSPQNGSAISSAYGLSRITAGGNNSQF